MRTNRRGFTLAEVVVTTVLMGVVFAPILYFVARTPDLYAAVAQQARREGYRTWQDQVMVTGTNPGTAPIYSPEINPAVPAIGVAPVNVSRVTPIAGVPALSAITTVPFDGPGEAGDGQGHGSLAAPSHMNLDRVGGGGFELGAGMAVAAPNPPVAPPPPIQMQTPNVSPAIGSVVPLAAFTAQTPGQPYRTNVQASVTDAGRVTLAMSAPAMNASGLGSATVSVSTVDFYNGVSGSTWNEYPGNAMAGDLSWPSVSGPLIWYVPIGEELYQQYDPSPNLTVASYQISLGPPVLVYEGAEYVSGSSIAVDYTAFREVETGAQSIYLDWSADVRLAFGGSAILQRNFNWSFQANAGGSAGNVGEFFTRANLGLWAATSVVQGSAIVPASVDAAMGGWSIDRVPTQLQPPDQTTASAMLSGTWEAGDVVFQVPVHAGSGERVGHPEVTEQNIPATNISVTDSVTSPIRP